MRRLVAKRTDSTPPEHRPYRNPLRYARQPHENEAAFFDEPFRIRLNRRGRSTQPAPLCLRSACRTVHPTIIGISSTSFCCGERPASLAMLEFKPPTDSSYTKRRNAAIRISPYSGRACRAAKNSRTPSAAKRSARARSGSSPSATRSHRRRRSRFPTCRERHCRAPA